MDRVHLYKFLNNSNYDRVTILKCSIYIIKRCTFYIIPTRTYLKRRTDIIFPYHRKFHLLFACIYRILRLLRWINRFVRATCKNSYNHQYCGYKIQFTFYCFHNYNNFKLIRIDNTIISFRKGINKLLNSKKYKKTEQIPNN